MTLTALVLARVPYAPAAVVEERLYAATREERPDVVRREFDQVLDELRAAEQVDSHLIVDLPLWSRPEVI